MPGCYRRAGGGARPVRALRVKGGLSVSGAGVAVTPACDHGAMPQQLVLIDPDGDRQRTNDDWRLDDETREVGLRGIAEARRILAEASRRSPHRSAA